MTDRRERFSSVQVFVNALQQASYPQTFRKSVPNTPIVLSNVESLDATMRPSVIPSLPTPPVTIMSSVMAQEPSVHLAQSGNEAGPSSIEPTTSDWYAEQPT